ncbi:tRNA (adenosine(37)-N6)-threonylcarbamoyltransferase complex dimerization subunit type 1 TsaB [Kushneria pakistanensis]|uniref:tRNA threonylcarbamoyladenosine biosynthesis protein TsaB n=1 Tax=Kushneria pakistanensis TaxID=1508770 RepID=A0ABQ3FAM9_9GAMM|nr:tRNA (adenosine(37)-N6)-threonylcarbamoyltransferase complex dimerization subunit type 1 TsaB [Kushneria pakistanensis]GHC16033.1 tRNA (adenosine(37)-N6)-threonylcarbamoyltransferase complex dimerization subunit type 1 TsaB [Kushneria pakistanensis]
MTSLLALDASSSACSVALWMDGNVIGRVEHAPRGHTRRLMPMIDALLDEAGIARGSLDAIAYGHGPGSFTGIRIAAGVAQGIAYGLERPLLGISTLRALALSAWCGDGAGLVMPALDARLGELYVALYQVDQGRPEVLMADSVMAPEALKLPSCQPWSITMIGSGVSLKDRLSDEVRECVGATLEHREPEACDIVQLAAMDFASGLITSPQEALPIYLRDQVVSSKR